MAPVLQGHAGGQGMRLKCSGQQTQGHSHQDTRRWRFPTAIKSSRSRGQAWRQSWEMHPGRSLLAWTVMRKRKGLTGDAQATPTCSRRDQRRERITREMKTNQDQNGEVRKQAPAGRRQGSESEALPRYPGATWRQASVTLGARMALVLR